MLMSRRAKRRRPRGGPPRASGGGHLGGQGGGGRGTGGGDGGDQPNPQYSFGPMVLAVVLFPLAFLSIQVLVVVAPRLFAGVR